LDIFKSADGLDLDISALSENIGVFALNLLLIWIWGVFYNPNFYNKVGIKCCPYLQIVELLLWNRSENRGRFYGRFNFCGGQQVKSAPKIFSFYDLLRGWEGDGSSQSLKLNRVFRK
jgi:hypothetical protein